MFIAELAHPRFARVRPLLAAHRHDGRLAVRIPANNVPDDIHGMFVSQGILTATRTTSHAARSAADGEALIVGAGALEIDEKARKFRVSGQTVKEGDFISFDGLSGEVKPSSFGGFRSASTPPWPA